MEFEGKILGLKKKNESLEMKGNAGSVKRPDARQQIVRRKGRRRRIS